MTSRVWLTQIKPDCHTLKNPLVYIRLSINKGDEPMNRIMAGKNHIDHHILRFTLICILCIITSPAMAQTDQFMAGAYASNITPSLGGLIVGGWKPIEASYIHDQLHARCLVLDNGNQRLVFVVCDLLGLPSEVCKAARKQIHENTDIPEQNIMISATHTHSAVSALGSNRLVEDEPLNTYQKFIVTRIADGVQCAIHNLEPAQIGWGEGNEPESVFNRRWFMKENTALRNPFGGVDQVRMNPPRGSSDLIKPAGPTDPEVPFLSIQTKDGEPIALLANYSLHYVGGVEHGAVSADYFGMFADRIQALLKANRSHPPFVGIMTNGTSGDINNINWKVSSEKRWGRYEKMRYVADLVAQAVYKAHQKMEFHDWVPLDARLKQLTLDVRKPTENQLAYANHILAQDNDRTTYHSREDIYANRIKKLHNSPDQITIDLQTFRIGELGISMIPFEVLVEIGLELKQKSPFKPSFTISMANGYFGYLPTIKQHQYGGYETWMGTNMVEKDTSNKIMKALLTTYNDLK